MSLIHKFQLWKDEIQNYVPEELDAVYEKYLSIFEGEPVPVIWMPDENVLDKSNIAKAISDLGLNSYEELAAWAANNHGNFWAYIIQKLGVKFHKPYTEILDTKSGVEDPVWLSNAKLNIVESCLIQNSGHTAIIEGKEGSQEVRRITYGELDEKSSAFANGLLKHGFLPGDKIVFYVPLCTEAIIAYLGVIKAGMVVVSVADSFSSEELRKRNKISDAKAVFTAEGYLYGGKWISVYNKVIEADSPKAIVLTGNDLKRDEDLLFESILVENDEFQVVYGNPQDTTNILFSSGTTKEPKAIPWTHLTPIKCASDGFFHQDIKSSDVVSWTTGMGWMMAPWLIYATLINKATISIFVGSSVGEEFGKFAEKTEITILGTIPSVVKVWKSENFHKKFNWKVRLYSSTGEPSNAEDYFYLMALSRFKAPIIEYCGGTEIGGAYITGSIAQASSPATFTTPALGLDFILLNGEHQPTNMGEVFIIPPSLGLTQKLLNKDHHAEYYEGTPLGSKGQVLRKHGDAFERIEKDGLVFYKSIGRTDDAMNLGGIKVSAVEIEEVLNLHPQIFETAAVSIPGLGGGPEKLIVFTVLNAIDANVPDLKKELQSMLSKSLNPLFKIGELKVVEKLPRTASNKLMRRELRNSI